MKPKTKLQKACAEAAATLPAIAPEVIQWGYDNCLEKIGHRTKKVVHCLECGHSWPTTDGMLISQVVGETCPACNSELKMKVSRARTNGDKAYYGQITTHKGWQVIRVFYMTKGCRVGEKAEYFNTEVMQHWINKEGKRVPWSLGVNGGTGMVDMWIFNSKLEIRVPASMRYSSISSRFDIVPYLFYPKSKILPEIKRNGFKGNYHKVAPQDFFINVLSDRKFETLLKAGRYELLKYPGTYYLKDKLDKFWPTIKICIRNAYKITNASDYFDYLDLLEFFGKDLRSPKYVCPADLKKEHDRYVAKKQAYLERKRLEEFKKRIEEEQKEYQEAKNKFFGINMSNGDITIKVIETVQEMYEEGKELHHCVFTNGYHKKPDSLILSARKDETRLETIELSLKSMKVIQSRGLQNNSTAYHNSIIELINNNLHIIKKRLTNGKDSTGSARKPERIRAGRNAFEMAPQRAG